jgi:hypothetical protein
MLFDSAIFRLWKLNLDGLQGATANRCVFQSILFEWGCFRMALTQRERHNANAKRRNAKTKQQLGMSASTAYHRLVKSLLFKLAKEAGKNFCFRCSTIIVTEEEFSIEHIEDWCNRKNACELYFALDNITFSHRSCNRKAAHLFPVGGWNKGNWQHGLTGYRYGCRCEICRQIYSEATKKWPSRRKPGESISQEAGPVSKTGGT